MNILITGATGYIGSHTLIALCEAGFTPILLDNFCNSKRVILPRLEAQTKKSLKFYEGDTLDVQLLNRIFTEQKIDAVIHFAALKAVGESTQKPLEYYQNNVAGCLNLLTIMKTHHVKRFIFSSSATVYGDPASVPIQEHFPRASTSPYGRGKLIIEEILEDLIKAESDWSITLLRYFNPIGAHESGQFGEDPQGIPNNLTPYITQVAIGNLEKVQVFGNDYPTPDGTGIRDYIHVMDLAEGHIAALKICASKAGLHIYNLGTGRGYSVLEVITAFSNAVNQADSTKSGSTKAIPYEIKPRRAGDIAECWADPTRAQKDLNWSAQRNLNQMAQDAWRWQTQNPKGYE